MAEGSIPEIVITGLVSLNQTVHVPILPSPSTNAPQPDLAFLSPDSRSRRPISLEYRSHSPSPTVISSNGGASLVVPPTLSTSVHVTTLSLRDNKPDELNHHSSLYLLKPPRNKTLSNVAPSTQPIPPIPIPDDLTSFINRCCEYPVSGGGYGDIYKCVYHGPDGDIDVAVKAIRSFVSAEVPRRELGIWKRLKHKNILKLMGTTRHFGPSVALVAPWIDNGSLTSFLSQNNGTLTLRDRLLLLRDIADGLNYLHTFSIDGHAYSNAVVHGDLTGNNVLVGSDGTAYIADFGLSGTLEKSLGMTYLVKMGCHPGALRWTAPELLDEESASAVTAKCDMYSFGCIVLQVLTGDVPWPHLTSAFTICRKVSFQGEMHPRPDGDHIIDRHWNFMTHCWSKIPDDRPSAEEALQFIDSELALEGSTLP
ncbi:kinase-like domain-containing protein [Suillus clintonianus]|uniref:kinase-like domain-containing protein n=1 Tax=Suillus clintonianus TaxID=1904413 RepID=UPI001B87F413|nr:kinase-like domain-containing protein [Suillus clintonianus]KAG2153970.1 kinase-like domain-containing protein [Suillus clintonianus]